MRTPLVALLATSIALTSACSDDTSTDASEARTPTSTTERVDTTLAHDPTTTAPADPPADHADDPANEPDTDEHGWRALVPGEFHDHFPDGLIPDIPDIPDPSEIPDIPGGGELPDSARRAIADGLAERGLDTTTAECLSRQISAYAGLGALLTDENRADPEFASCGLTYDEIVTVIGGR